MSNKVIGTASEAVEYAALIRRSDDGSMSHNEQRIVALADALTQVTNELSQAADVARRGKIASTGATEKWRALVTGVRS